MSTAQRIGFAALAVIVALVALVALSSGSDEADERADQAPAALEETTTPEPEASPTETPTATSTPTPTPKPKPPAAKVVRFRDGEVVGGLARLTFEKGETARFAIASDVAEEVHVHGYDIEKPVAAGGTARFAFRADIDGVFEIELHGSGTQLAQLRVEP